MRTNLASLPLLLVTLVACPAGDDEDTSNTTVSMTTTASTGPTTDPGTDSTGATTEPGTDTGSSTQGVEESSAGETTTGTGPEVCDTCDPTTEICFASIFDGPTEYSCRPIPAECTDDVTCECITPVECPRSLESCEIEGELVVVNCVEG